MTKKKALTDSQKLDYLMNKVAEIDKAVNPPFWKKLLTWFINHFWTLLFLAVIGYFMWQVWEIVQAVQAQVNAVQTQVDIFKNGVTNQFSVVGEAIDQIKNFEVQDLKFWE